MCEKAEARFQIRDRSFVTDDMELEGPRRVHYRGLGYKVFFVSRTRPTSLRKSEKKQPTFSRIAPSVAELSENMIRAKTTGSIAIF